MTWATTNWGHGRLAAEGLSGSMSQKRQQAAGTVSSLPLHTPTLTVKWVRRSGRGLWPRSGPASPVPSALTPHPRSREGPWAPWRVPASAIDAPGPTERLPPRHPADAVGHVQPGPDPLLHPAVPGFHGVSAAAPGRPSSGQREPGAQDQEARVAGGRSEPTSPGSSGAREAQSGSWTAPQEAAPRLGTGP